MRGEQGCAWTQPASDDFARMVKNIEKLVQGTDAFTATAVARIADEGSTAAGVPARPVGLGLPVFTERGMSTRADGDKGAAGAVSCSVGEGRMSIRADLRREWEQIHIWACDVVEAQSMGLALRVSREGHRT